jgi:hypothetical protein
MTTLRFVRSSKSGPHVSVEQHRHRSGRVEFMARHEDTDPLEPDMVTLSANIERMDPEELEETRERALREPPRGEDFRRKHWAALLTLSDQQLGERDFETRLERSKRAIGRSPSREDRQAAQKAAEVRAAMEGWSPDPAFDSRVAAARAALSPGPDVHVAARARATRASIEKARPATRSSPSGSFEDRLASAKAALGRS